MTDENKTPAHNTMQVLDDGIIELKLAGYQTPKTIVEHSGEISALIKEHREKKTPALIMVDISGVTGHESMVREIAHNNLTNDFDSMAIVTADNITARLIGNWLVKIVGQGERVRFFEQRNDALEWLKTEVQSRPQDV